MLDKRKKNSEKAFSEACKKNGLIYRKYNKGTKKDYIKLVDEEGNSFHLNNDLSIKKCSFEEEDNGFAATNEEVILDRASYKIQKGLQKA